jgi:hypothetical protein
MVAADTELSRRSNEAAFSVSLVGRASTSPPSDPMTIQEELGEKNAIFVGVSNVLSLASMT